MWDFEPDSSSFTYILFSDKRKVFVFLFFFFEFTKMFQDFIWVVKRSTVIFYLPKSKDTLLPKCSNWISSFLTKQYFSEGPDMDIHSIV